MVVGLDPRETMRRQLKARVRVDEKRQMLGALVNASSTLSSFLRSLLPHASPCDHKLNRSVSMASSARIAVVGDVHGDWDLREDSIALQLLQPDVVLFTGDFGEENVEIVQQIADLKFSKAIILGNHDAWYTQEFSRKRKDGVQLQLECLGEEHVAYGRLDFPLVKLSIVGGRPFSHGGVHLFRRKLLLASYGVQDIKGSAKRIYDAALGTPEGHVVIFLAHNGPTGLGSNLNDICGKDWVVEGGDHGDQDLEQAISRVKQTGKLRIPLVVFGHMHKELAHRNGLRKMIAVGPDDTIFLNGAVVPRVKSLSDDHQGHGKRSSMTCDILAESSTKRAFTIVDLSGGRVDKIAETWVSVKGDLTQVEEECVLYERGSCS